MKFMQTSRNLVLAAMLASAGAAHAQQPPAAASEPVQGEVRKVDKENRKITVRHGDIPSLDMPPMTMVFSVHDPALLDGVKPGDSIRFRATSENGTLYIIEMKATP